MCSSRAGEPPGVPPDQPARARPMKTCSRFSGPEPGQRKRVTRKADGKLTLLVNLGGVLARKAKAFGYPFQLTHFSLPISGPLKDA